MPPDCHLAFLSTSFSADLPPISSGAGSLACGRETQLYNLFRYSESTDVTLRSPRHQPKFFPTPYRPVCNTLTHTLAEENPGCILFRSSFSHRLPLKSQESTEQTPPPTNILGRADLKHNQNLTPKRRHCSRKNTPRDPAWDSSPSLTVEQTQRGWPCRQGRGYSPKEKQSSTTAVMLAVENYRSSCKGKRAVWGK